MSKDKFPYYYNDELSEEENLAINQEILQYAGMYVLKEMELAQDTEDNEDDEDNENTGDYYSESYYEEYRNGKNQEDELASEGHIFEVPLPPKDEILEPVLDSLLFSDRITISPEKGFYELTQEGQGYIDRIIEELESYIDRYESMDSQTRVLSMQRDRVDPLRARFLWGLCDGEFDDLTLWQNERGIYPVVGNWQNWLVSKDFYDRLTDDIFLDPKEPKSTN